ncbi:MAG: hypothetical protein ACE14P_09895 [Methanotrichaceae archaeon]
MADATLYEILGVSKERANEIAKIVRNSFSKSRSPADWIKELIDEFGITPETAEVFACGWFAGRYAGVSEVFNIVQQEMDKIEKDKAEKAEKESRYPQSDGYV